MEAFCLRSSRDVGLSSPNQTSPDGDTNLLVTAQYRDWIVETGGELKFREKRVVYDTFRLPDSVVYPL